jgi:hypothetical protein
MSKSHASLTQDDTSDTVVTVENVWDPTSFAQLNVPTGFSSTAPLFTAATIATSPLQTLYLTEPGNTTAISASDLYQGQMGDCFLISSIGEIALEKPVAISNMIKVNSNGTETVTLYTASNGQLPGYSTSAFRPISINVTNVFPTYSVNNGKTQDVVGGVKEIWPQVLEKAYATLNGGYANISNGGSPVLAMEELTGQKASFIAPASLTYASLEKYISAGDMIVMDTSSASKLPYNLVSDHAYMFEKVTGANGAAMVTLLNPWGYDQPAAIPLSQLSKAFVEIDIGKVG